MDVTLASVPITGLSAALLTVVLIALGFQIGPFRLKAGVSLGDGGNPELLDRIRRHANFIENVPLALLLLAIMALLVTPAVSAAPEDSLLGISLIDSPAGDTLSVPMQIMLVIIEEPPWLMKGRGMPTTGARPITIIRLTAA